jgi:dihydrofolate reductase
MNTMPKIVFSRTLKTVEWNNTRLVKGDTVKEISEIKQQPGKDLLIFGSADLASTLTNLGLIDEYRIMVNPVVLGKGNPLFKDIKEKLNLRLLRTRTFSNGNVLLYYEPVK